MDAIRIRAFPFHESVSAFINAHRQVFVVEQNRDAQMLSLLKMDLPAELLTRLRSVLHYNGLPIDARSVTSSILAQEN